MIGFLRRMGIAIGSLIAAWVMVSLIAGLLLGPAASGNLLIWLMALALGGVIYGQIVRRERPAP